VHWRARGRAVDQFYKVTVTLATKVKSWQQELDHLLWRNHKNLAWQKIMSKVSFLGSIHGTASDISIAGSSGQGTYNRSSRLGKSCQFVSGKISMT